MTDEKFLEVCRKALAWVSPDRKDDFAQVGLDTPFADVRLDSLTLLEMVGEVEKELGITFEDDDLESLTTLRQLLELTRRVMSPG